MPDALRSESIRETDSTVASSLSILPQRIDAITRRPSVMCGLYLRFSSRNPRSMRSRWRAVRPAIIALIASAGVTIAVLAFWSTTMDAIRLSDTDGIAIFLFAVGLFVLRKWKADPIYVMVGSGVAGLGLYSLFTYLL